MNHQTESVLAVLQYHENLLLRPQQMEAIKRLLAAAGAKDPLIRPLGTFSPSGGEGKIEGGYLEGIEKIIMGGGKSKVILPVLARRKASGSNLVVVEVPPALFETNCADLSYTSGRLFNQKVYPFKFNRDSDCSPKSLTFLYAKLIEVMGSKDYVVTTGDAMQSLELKYLEMLLQRPEDAKAIAVWTQQVAGLEQLVTLFRTRADVVMDEVHQALLLKKKLNYTLGNQRAVPTTIITECVELYRFFDQVVVGDVLGAAFAGKSLTFVLENSHWLTTDEQWQACMLQLTHALLEDPASPLSRLLLHMDPKLSVGDKASLFSYLSNKGDEIPACVLRAHAKTRTIFALYKEQVSQLLSQTLKRKLNEHYGASKQRLDDKIAIPYVANNIASERSRFGNYLEAINYSIQMLLMDGFSPTLLKDYLGQLQAQARHELLKDPSLGRMDNTPTARGFQALSVPSQPSSPLGDEIKEADQLPLASWSLSQLHLDDPVQFNLVFEQLRRNKAFIFEVLKKDVLPQLHVEAEILHSDAFNHVDIYRSCQGLTGTPSNSSTYHQRLGYDKTTAAATDGFILQLLAEKQTGIRSVAITSPGKVLHGVLSGVEASESVRAIIDICAIFKGISNLDVTRSIATYVREHPAQFSTPTSLKYILFFNDDNMLCALDLNEKSKPIMIGSSDPEVINSKLGCTPDARFSYYDQSHTVGVDLKQSRRAKALVMVDHETQLQNFLQGCMRMRGLDDEQCIDIIVPDNVANRTLEPLIDRMAANEERQLQQDNFTAAQAKLANLIRADLMQRLLALPTDAVEKKHAYAVQFKDYFVEQSSSDFFAVYGGLAALRPANDILNDQRDRLLKDWSRIVSALPDEIIEPLAMRTQMDEIIQSALPRCQASYLSPTRQEQGMEVEVQKQVQVELQRETQLEKELFNPSLEPHRYVQWPYLVPSHTDYSRFIPRVGLMKLSELCAASPGLPIPDFGEIYVSSNYYQAYKGQTQFMGAYLKPVHALLFRQRSNGMLDCLIVSQQEADELMRALEREKSPGIWMCTTQHTLLAGKPPAGIIDYPAYQDLIEKVRFFNGEFNLLLDNGPPLNWLSEETGKKMAFFEHYLLPYRETDQKAVLSLGQALSQRQTAFRYIAQHPFKDYSAFEWREQIHNELTDDDIDECVKLAQAFADANAHWREEKFSRETSRVGLGLSLQASSFINQYIKETLAALRSVFPLYRVGTVDELSSVMGALLPALIEDYVPLLRSQQQQPLQFLLKKASKALDPQALLFLADWLIRKGDDINHKDRLGGNALTDAITGGGDRVIEQVQWLLKRRVDLSAPSGFQWGQVDAATLDQLFLHVKELLGNDLFIQAYIREFRTDDKKICYLMDHHLDAFKQDTRSDLCIALLNNPDVILEKNHLLTCLLFVPPSNQGLMMRIATDPAMDEDVLQRLIERLKVPADRVIADPLIEKPHFISALLSNPLVRKSEFLVALLLQSVSPATQEAIRAIVASPSQLASAELSFAIRQSRGDVNILLRLTETHAESLGHLHLNALLAALSSRKQEKSADDDRPTIELLQKIIHDVHADSAVQEAAICYALQRVPSVIEDLFSDPRGLMWTTFGVETLVYMISKLPAKLTQDIVRSAVILHQSALHVQALLGKCSLAQRQGVLGAISLLPNLGLEMIGVLLDKSNLPYVDVNRLLIDHPIELEAKHLIALLTTLDAQAVQVILPQIVSQQAVDLDVLHTMITVMQQPAKECLMPLLQNKLFTTNAMLVRQLVDKVDASDYEWVLAHLITKPSLSPEVLATIAEMIEGIREPSSLLIEAILMNDALLKKADLTHVLTRLIADNQSNAARLMALLVEHGDQFNREHLLAMLPKNDEDVNLLGDQKLATSKLFLMILEHKLADDVVCQRAIHAAMSVGLERQFWRAIPATIDTIDLSGHELGNRSPLELREILRSLTHVTHLNLSNNQLGQQDIVDLARILSTLAPTVLKLDLSDNGIDSQMPYLLASVPSSVTHIAYKNHDYQSRADINAQVTDYSFVFGCLSSIAMVAGGALLAAGLYILAPLLIGIGAGVVMIAAIGLGLSALGLFSHKPVVANDELDDDFLEEVSLDS